MFRRKEEITADLISQEGSSSNSNGQMQAAPVSPIQETAAPISINAQSTQPSYAPAARPAAPASNPYRPSSIGDMARRPEGRPSTLPAAANDKSSVGTKSNRRVLTVGNDIFMKGEITTCDRLVIEGKVDAKLSDVHTVEIAESGSFKGQAEVEDAEISGVFEGDLVVRNRLVIYSSGKVRGKITYGEIEIERGGEITGDIKTMQSAGMPAKGSTVKAQEERQKSFQTVAA